jgi:hypothetical protein
MPDFNTFRTNELLLGKVLVARQNVDLSASEDEQMEVRQFLHELEEKKRSETSTLYLKFIGLLTGKKYIQLRDKFGQKIIREVSSEVELKPELRISVTTERQIDFGDDVNAWRAYIHEENIRSEEKTIKRQERANDRKLIIEAYSQIITNIMMRVN